MRPVERRVYITEFEARAVGDGFTIAGHAAVFDKFSQDLGGFVERIAPGAFKKTLGEADVRALFNHDPNFVLGRYQAGRAGNTLSISEDRSGLHYEVRLGNQTYARDLYESIDRGDITQSSFAFRTIADDWQRTADGYPLRTLTQVSLHNGDVSPVTYPAYEDTDIAARAVEHLAQRTGVDAPALVAAIRDGVLPSEALETRNPYEISEDDPRCPADEPHAVVKSEDGSLVACHETVDDAVAHLGALEANVPDAAAALRDLRYVLLAKRNASA